MEMVLVISILMKPSHIIFPEQNSYTYWCETPGRFGEIVVDNGSVKTFLEKPQTSAGLINGGCFP